MKAGFSINTRSKGIERARGTTMYKTCLTLAAVGASGMDFPGA